MNLVEFQAEYVLVGMCFSGSDCEYEFVVVPTLSPCIESQRHCERCARRVHLECCGEAREGIEPLAGPPSRSTGFELLAYRIRECTHLHSLDLEKGSETADIKYADS